MPSSAIQNPAPAESKSAKKKKAKVERTESPAPTASPAPEKANSISGADGADDSFESPYIREIQKYAFLSPVFILSAFLISMLGIFAMLIRRL
jgi:hypothetical protein